MSLREPGVVVWTDSIRPSAAPSGAGVSVRPRGREWSKLARRAVLLGVPLGYLALLLVGPLIAVVEGLSPMAFRLSSTPSLPPMRCTPSS